MTSYPTALLRDICDSIEYGYTASSTVDHVGPRFVRITDIVPDILDWESVPYCEIDQKKLAKHRLCTGDIVIARTGATTGWAKYIKNPPEAVFASYLVRIRLKNSVVPRYIGFVVESSIYKEFIQQHMGGAAQPNANAQVLTSFEIPLPPLSVQHRIASVLSAYDELIENSQRRIKILKSMARALYREWFVNFRFPGHKSTPRVQSSLGEIPQGWEVKRLFDLTKVNYGKNLPTKKLIEDGPYPVYGAAKIIGRYTEYTKEQRTIVCGCRGSVGEMQITQPMCYVTNNSFTFDPTHEDDFFWLFQTLKERGLRDVIGGAAQPQITLDGISSVELLTPPLSLRARFQETVLPIFKQAWLLESQIDNLRRTRDLLLPRLLSGQINMESLS